MEFVSFVTLYRQDCLDYRMPWAICFGNIFSRLHGLGWVGIMLGGGGPDRDCWCGPPMADHTAGNVGGDERCLVDSGVCIPSLESFDGERREPPCVLVYSGWAA